MNIYETEKLLGEYLLFHYGSAAEIAPPLPGMEEALFYPVRCVAECLDLGILPAKAEALDVGCAVGRSTFELARHCERVIGIDYSRCFIAAADHIRRDGAMSYRRTDEGDLATELVARLPDGIDPARVAFETGDAMALRDDLGAFDVVLGANLIDRLSDPAQFLERLPSLVKTGGQLILTSPYTWMEEFTPRNRWLGGLVREGFRVATLAGLRQVLDLAFDLVAAKELPFLIREHARKFQLTRAQATIWRRHSSGV
jgi:putative 4-mercaptohistidine N1-methyltranferase